MQSVILFEGLIKFISEHCTRKLLFPLEHFEWFIMALIVFIWFQVGYWNEDEKFVSTAAYMSGTNETYGFHNRTYIVTTILVCLSVAPFLSLMEIRIQNLWHGTYGIKKVYFAINVIQCFHILTMCCSVYEHCSIISFKIWKRECLVSLLQAHCYSGCVNDMSLLLHQPVYFHLILKVQSGIKFPAVLRNLFSSTDPSVLLSCVEVLWCVLVRLYRAFHHL